MINILVAFVAFLHLYFLILEMFLWTTPKGLKVFAQSKEQAEATKVLAANQGLYNGFLAFGLVWSLFVSNQEVAYQFKIFFLSCITVAGCYGGYSVNKKIFFVQSIPALLTLILLIVW